MAKTARVCGRAGCPEIIIGRNYCEPHTFISPAPKRNQNAQGYDYKWRVYAKQYLVKHPVCCVVGCDSPSRDVDHIDNLGPKGPRGYDPSNLQPLCHSHHSQKTWLYTRGAKKPPAETPST